MQLILAKSALWMDVRNVKLKKYALNAVRGITWVSYSKTIKKWKQVTAQNVTKIAALATTKVLIAQVAMKDTT